MNGNGHQQDGTGALLGTNSVSSASTSKPEVKKKTRDSDCCSVNFLKYVLHIFNVVFMVAGLAVFSVGLWTVISKHQYVSLLSTITYPMAAYVLLAAGTLAAFASILGYCGLWRENRSMLLCYTYFLLLIFVLEAMVGVLAYVYEEQVTTELQANLNNTFLENYRMVQDKTKAIDSMQINFKCCGAVRHEDWKASAWLRVSLGEKRLVPDSCCKSVTPRCGIRDHPSNIHYTGCIRPMANHIRDHLIILGAVGLGISVIPIFGMVVSCCIYVKLKDILD
ncbi:CD151 antigen-like [Arctopsyche grandis]|uniref:CD151 antigen-like n=1 Tax=Arctopsyche grandis TaxID=121162 RepID=UPI00406D80A9